MIAAMTKQPFIILAGEKGSQERVLEELKSQPIGCNNSYLNATTGSLRITRWTGVGGKQRHHGEQPA